MISEWKRSQFCEAGACVEVRRCGAEIQVRDSKDPDGPVLSFSETYWDWMLGRLAVGAAVAPIVPDNGGVRWWNQIDGWVFLDFTAAEWAAFTDAVRAGEFDFGRLAEVGS
jgi:hypothetical protein